MDVIASLVVAVISALLGSAGGFLTARAQNQKAKAEAERLLADARQIDAESLRDTVTTLMSRITQQDQKIASQEEKITALSARVLELEDERDELYAGIRVLIEQLELNKICPDWKPQARKTR